ncbi:MAG: bifunctional ADP-heptose synthase [Bacteroidia bacterium]
MSVELKALFSSFNNLTVLIIGDVMIDSYLWGSVTRISPEAPVPIVDINKKNDRLGGAANVALNIQAMGAKPILCSIIGNDKNGKLFFDLLKKQKISSDQLVKSKQRSTTVKTRIIGNNHQLIRVDEETNIPANKTEADKIIKNIKKIITEKKIDVIIFEDYDKGCLTPTIINSVISLAAKEKIPIVVDPKKNNFWEYKNVTLFKPNLKELKEGIQSDFDHNNIKELTEVVSAFIKKQKIESALITLSDKGLYIHTNETKIIVPAHMRNISDVSGAGDTVVSITALCIALKLSAVKTATLANLSGGLVCEQTGVVPINKKQLFEEAVRLKL